MNMYQQLIKDRQDAANAAGRLLKKRVDSGEEE